MGSGSSALNQPPPAGRPKQRAKQSHHVMMTELSDLGDDDFTIQEPTLVQYHGRTGQTNGFIKEDQKARAAEEMSFERQMKNKELRRIQDERLKEKRSQEMHNFRLVKEEDQRFKLEQARIQAEVVKKHQELVAMEEKANRMLREEQLQQEFIQQQNIDSNGNFVFEPETEERVNVAHQPTVRNPAKFNLTGVTKSGWAFEDRAVQDLDKEPEPRPPTYRKRDIVQNTHQFNLFDKHAVKAPFRARESIASLVTYLKSGAENHLQLVRMFYRWITFNIAFDVEGYYGETQLQSVEPEGVLQAGLTISEGYANLMQAMCKFEGIPVKIIQGIVKGYEYQIGDIINFTESHLWHFWNAVYINKNWFFVDCAWGAGLVDRKRNWIRQFQEFYFIVDPDKMIVDHFPFMDNDLRESAKWQLLASPVSANSFNQRLKLERAALEWDVKPVTHTQHHIITVRREIEIQLQEVADILEEYSVQFQRKDGSRNLDQFFFACKLNNRTLKITLRPPEQVDYILNIYGQKSLDAAGKSEVLVTYILKCVDVLEELRQFPPNFRIYGAVPNYQKFGFSSEITKCCEYTCNSGEMILPIKTKRSVKVMTKLEHIDEKADLTNFCLVTAKDHGISVKMRFPFEGYYKFTLFGKEDDAGNFRPVATFLIDCNQASHVHSGFPVAFDAALELKCTLFKPLWKDLPANSTITVVMGCENIVKASLMYKDLVMDENHVFEGTVTTPPAGQPFTIYGQKTEKSPLVGLFHFTIF
ncbi:kyphoscoliosis peptidase-like [Dreissena polymorpha]|uniref:kyphoscoliosis peptidase-like n=1 Tax=Dreissena polymorpha TaxID=45954 RepID=UPI002264B133|nr:kyphoscoliosis peptidase-like [Dreissena polymorpha]